MSRIMVAWQPIGISMGVYDMCHRSEPHLSFSAYNRSFFYQYTPIWLAHLTLDRYLKERKQFGAPLAAFQLNQEKLVRMLGNIQAMLLVGWRLCKLYESGKMTPGHASLGKVCKLQVASKWSLRFDQYAVVACTVYWLTIESRHGRPASQGR